MIFENIFRTEVKVYNIEPLQANIISNYLKGQNVIKKISYRYKHRILNELVNPNELVLPPAYVTNYLEDAVSSDFLNHGLNPKP